MAEKDKRCQVKMSDDTPCGRKLYDNEHCIFHSEKREKEKFGFQQRLDELFKDNSLEIYDFSHFIFPEGISFPKEIDKKIILREATFQGTIIFSGVTFYRTASFENTTFQDKALFSEVTFEKQVCFVGATFKSETHFYRTSFLARCIIKKLPQIDTNGAILQTHARSPDVILKELASSIEGFDFFHISGHADFRRVTFEDSLIIDADPTSGYVAYVAEKEEVDFSYVRFLKPEKVRFRKVDLSMFRFLETDLRKVEFIDVHWDRGKRRNRIYDEIERVSGLLVPLSFPISFLEFDYPLIARVYKRLRANYEENLNYAEAGDFHIGEMECKRKSYKTWFGKYLSLTALYKYVSHYGESYRRPLLFWILPILLLFPILFMYSGIEKVTPTQFSYLIDYDFNVSSISLNKAGDWSKDYLKSFVYSLSVFSLVREKQYRPIDNWGHFWMVLESILSPVLIAFFLLALRRRFRR